MLTPWGHWNSQSGQYEEVCNIRSALVSEESSSALLRALQSADDHHDYIIPDAEDDRQIDFGPFQLKGWIVDRTHDRGLDEKDPWAGRIGYPAPTPSREIIDALNLIGNHEGRNWRRGEAAPEAMICETWGMFLEKDDNRREERGDRVQVSVQFARDLLQCFGMDMIIEVEITQRRSYSRYESHNDDDAKRIPPRTRVFLVKSDGQVRTI
jgi:hypothetical protein